MKNELYLFFLVFSIIYTVYCHRCGTDLIHQKPSIIKINATENSKRYLSNEFTPIKIKVDLTYLKNQKESKNIPIDNLKKSKNFCLYKSNI